MHYKALFEAINWFRRDTYAYDSAYFRYQNNIDWKRLNNFSDDEIATQVLGFLNAWRCRISITNKVITRIRDAYTGILPYIQAFKSTIVKFISYNESYSV